MLSADRVLPRLRRTSDGMALVMVFMFKSHVNPVSGAVVLTRLGGRDPESLLEVKLNRTLSRLGSPVMCSKSRGTEPVS